MEKREDIPWYGLAHIGEDEAIVRPLAELLKDEWCIYAESNSYCIWRKGEVDNWQLAKRGLKASQLQSALETLGALPRINPVIQVRISTAPELDALVHERVFRLEYPPRHRYCDIGMPLVIEYLTRDGVGQALCGFDLFFRMNYRYDGTNCFAAFDMREMSDPNPLFSATHPRMGVAVCLAALKVAGVEVKLHGNLRCDS